MPGATRAPVAAASTARGDATNARNARLNRHLPRKRSRRSRFESCVDVGPSALERPQRRRGREFRATGGKAEAVAGHRIDEPAGVAGSQQPVDRLTRAVNGERSEHDRRRDPPRGCRALAQDRIARQLAIKQASGVAKIGICGPRGSHQADVRQPARHRRDADVPSPPDVHLSEDGRDARSPWRRSLRSRRRWPSGAAVGGWRASPRPNASVEWRPSAAMVTGAVRSISQSGVAVTTPQTRAFALLVDDRASDPDRRLELAASGNRLLQQQPVKIAPEDRQPVLALRIPSLDGDATLAGDQHPATRRLALAQVAGRYQVRQPRDGPRIDRVAAQLVARKCRAIDDADARSGAREQRPGHGAGRPGADDQDVAACHVRVTLSRAPARCSWIRSRGSCTAPPRHPRRGRGWG